MVAVFWVMAVMGLAIVASLRVARYQAEVVSSQVAGIEARDGVANDGYFLGIRRIAKLVGFDVLADSGGVGGVTGEERRYLYSTKVHADATEAHDCSTNIKAE